MPDGERTAGQRVGNPVVGRAHDAADRLRAIAQRRRPADHLDLVRGQRIDRHEVVFAEVGHAAAAHAVVDDADAIDVEAADDRPARCAGRKARAGDAGLGEQHVAQGRAGAALDLLPCGTTVTVANWSVTIGSAPCSGISGWRGGRCCRSGGGGRRSRRPAPDDRARRGDVDLRQSQSFLGRRLGAAQRQQCRRSQATTREATRYSNGHD